MIFHTKLSAAFAAHIHACFKFGRAFAVDNLSPELQIFVFHTVNYFYAFTQIHFITPREKGQKKSALGFISIQLRPRIRVLRYPSGIQLYLYSER